MSDNHEHSLPTTMNTILPTSAVLFASVALGGLLAAGPVQGTAPSARSGPVVCTVDDTHSLALFQIGRAHV